jgi:hypothetical protein
MQLFEWIGSNPRMLRQIDADENSPLRADRKIVAIEFERQKRGLRETSPFYPAFRREVAPEAEAQRGICPASLRFGLRRQLRETKSLAGFAPARLEG